MLIISLLGCLIHEDVYEGRRAELADADEDGWLAEEDCDDADASVHPGALEACDGIDQDCDGEVDEGAGADGLYEDEDGDGFGGAPLLGCDVGGGAVANGEDCDDQALTVNPAAEEVAYDGVDQDCDGGDLDDLDADGHAGGESGPDCDDQDAGINPEAAETWADGATDNDCDGTREQITEEFGAVAWYGESAGAWAGHRVARLGDSDGDGREELLIGATLEGRAGAMGGAVYRVQGSAGGPLAEEAVLLPGEGGAFLGGSLDGGRDLDGDEVPDLIVGATGTAGGTGSAWIVSGAELGSDLELVIDDVWHARVDGTRAGDYAGSRVRLLGDVTGDGVEDLAVGAPLASAGGFSQSGLVAIGSPEEGVVLAIDEMSIQVHGGYDGAAIGNEIGPAGDIDLDGYADILVSVGAGDIAVVLPGPLASGPHGDALFRLTGTGAGEAGDVRMLGDVDGDGRNDLAWAGPEDVLVFTALAGSAVRVVDTPYATIHVGEGSYAYEPLDLGDLDGDGSAETIVPVIWYEPLDTALVSVVFGGDLQYGATLDVADTALRAVAVRPEAHLGYRSVLADVDGDGISELALGGYQDDEGATDAGAVTLLTVPR